MKRLLPAVIISVLVFLVTSAAWYGSKLHSPVHTAPTIVNNKKLKDRLREKAAIASQFCKTEQFNTQVCFLADMSIESGKERLFVYDMKRDTILSVGLVTHGSCNQNWLSGREYGNTEGCGCTSLGKYKIGNSYHGKFGLAYKLYGLDATNSNAYNRFVVLHSMQCVPENAVYPYPICQSNGCPAVSPSFLKSLTNIIESGNGPVLLWIFDQ